MKKQLCLIILTTLLITKGRCQNIINGDFEINNASNCLWNLSDAAYNNAMSNSWSFGNNIQSGIDIEKSSCGIINSPSNIWFVSLSKNPLFAGGWGNDELSLELTTNLTTGNTYQISYFEASNVGGSNFNIPIEIGLSLDSLTFGQVIHSSLPDSNVWTNRTFKFIAPNNGKYLTVHNEPLDTLQAWNSVDNFQFISLTDINDISFDQTFSIYPNPFAKELNVILSNNEFSEIILYDIASRKIIQQKFTNSVSLYTEQLAEGLYLYELRSKDGSCKKGKVVKN